METHSRPPQKRSATKVKPLAVPQVLMLEHDPGVHIIRDICGDGDADVPECFDVADIDHFGDAC
jgi:hypothetical protein